MARILALLACVATVPLLAGCADDGATTVPPGQVPDYGRLIQAPQNLTSTGSAQLSITNPSAVNTLPPFADKCERPTIQCFDNPFNVTEPAGEGNITGNLTMTAVVSWSDDMGEFGLQLLDGAGAVLAEQFVGDPAGSLTSNTLTSLLAPGDYNVRVVAYRVYDDSFALAVNFTVELPEPAAEGDEMPEEGQGDAAQPLLARVD